MLIKVVRDGEPNSFDASHALSKNNRKFAKLVGLLNDIRANHRSIRQFLDDGGTSLLSVRPES